METEIDNVDVETTETDTEVATEVETTEPTETKAKEPEAPEAKLARLERQAAQLRKKLGKDAPLEKEVVEQKPDKTGDLDYGQKAYLTATLGIKGSAEWALVREYVSNGKSIDDLGDNRHFQNDLKDLREAAETKAATPSSSRRSGSGGQDEVEVALARFEQTRKLPDDFKLRAAVVNAQVEKQNATLPPWKRK